MNFDEIIRRYTEEERDFNGIEIYFGQKAVSVNLSGANFSHARLEAVNLEEVNLAGANLSQANFSRSNLKKANLSGANLYLATFCISAISPFKSILPASLEKANLEGANLHYADLREVYLAQSNLKNANLKGANLASADLSRANLSGANLTGANLFEANLSRANLTDVILDNANLQDANLIGAIMPDGTVRDSVALNLLTSKLDPVKRKAWQPITKRGDGDLTASKFAGKPWLSAGEKWPTCPSCGNPMRFFMQLNLQELPDDLEGKFGSGILQMFYCLNERFDSLNDAIDEYERLADSATYKLDRNGRIGSYFKIKNGILECFGYESFSSCQLVRIVRPNSQPADFEIPQIQDNLTRAILDEVDFSAKLIIDWQVMDDYPGFDEAEMNGVTLNQQELETIIQETDINEDEDEIEDFSYSDDRNDRELHESWDRNWIVGTFMEQASMYTREVDKLAGWPCWTQYIDYPNCPICNQVMNQLIFQLNSYDNVTVNWCHSGIGYFLQCPEHKEIVAFLWQC